MNKQIIFNMVLLALILDILTLLLTVNPVFPLKNLNVLVVLLFDQILFAFIVKNRNPNLHVG